MPAELESPLTHDVADAVERGEVRWERGEQIPETVPRLWPADGAPRAKLGFHHTAIVGVLKSAPPRLQKLLAVASQVMQ